MLNWSVEEKASRNIRKRIETQFARLKRILRLGRLRPRGVGMHKTTSRSSPSQHPSPRSVLRLPPIKPISNTSTTAERSHGQCILRVNHGRQIWYRECSNG